MTYHNVNKEQIIRYKGSLGIELFIESANKIT